MRISRMFLVHKEGEAIPKGYGLAYWDFCRAEGIFFPIPFNLIARCCAYLYWNIVSGFHPNKFEAMLIEEYHKGWKMAWDIANKNEVEHTIKEYKIYGDKIRKSL